MSVKYPIPMPNALVLGAGGLPTREWYNYWQNLADGSGGPTNEELLNDITIISEKLGSPDGTPENIPPLPESGNVVGLNSIFSQGVLPGIVTLTLQGDVQNPGNTYYYGTDSSGAKSFYSISSALLPSSNVTLTTDAGGQVTFDLSDLTPGTSGRLYGLAFDAKGRLSQQHTLDVVGVTNRTTVTGGDGSGATIGVDISATYVGQTSITTLGTVTTGTWNGSLIGVAYGGTGANLSGTGGAAQYVKQSTVGGAFTVGTIPASDIGSGQALTATNDTNVTITLGGTPASALLKAISISMGWTGTLSISRGGTGQTTANAAYNALSPMTTNGDIEIRAGGVATRLGVGSAGQVLGVSGGLPAWVAAGGGGTVTSVGLAAPAQFNVTNSPVTSSGTLTLAWANQNANLVLAGPASGASAAPTFRALVAADVPLPTDYITGLKINWVSNTQISVDSGACWIPGFGALKTFVSTVSLSPTLAASTQYHVYAFDNSGTAAIEAVTTAPSAVYFGRARTKTGDATRRYLGSILTNSSSQIINFTHTPALSRIDYRTGIGGSPFMILANGRATTATNISCSAVVPTTATHVLCFDFNDPTTSATVLTAASDGAVVPGAFEGFVAAGAQVSGVQRLDSSQAFSYAYQSAPAGSLGFTVRVNGYLFER